MVEHQGGTPEPSSAKVATTSTFYDRLASGHRMGVAGLFYSLLIGQSNWIFRRVESVIVAGECRFRRQMSIDFQVPRDVVEAAKTMGLDNFPVPLM